VDIIALAMKEPVEMTVSSIKYLLDVF
jgi:hypothetical protein